MALGGDNDPYNLVLLCEEHHKLLHLGDLETCTTILEYVYYIKNQELPSDIIELERLVEEMKNRYMDMEEENPDK